MLLRFVGCDGVADELVVLVVSVPWFVEQKLVVVLVVVLLVVGRIFGLLVSICRIEEKLVDFVWLQFF